MKSAHSNLYNWESLQKKQKCLNLGQKMPSLTIFENFKILLSYLKLAPSKLPKFEILQKPKISKFGTKNVLSGHFWARIGKAYCYI